MKRVMTLLFAVAALFTACKKDKDTKPNHGTPTAIGTWNSNRVDYKNPTITNTRMYWDSITYDGDSITLTSTLIIKQYTHGFPDTAYSYRVSPNNDSLYLTEYYAPHEEVTYSRAN